MLPLLFVCLCLFALHGARHRRAQLFYNEGRRKTKERNKPDRQALFPLLLSEASVLRVRSRSCCSMAECLYMCRRRRCPALTVEEKRLSVTSSSHDCDRNKFASHNTVFISIVFCSKMFIKCFSLYLLFFSVILSQASVTSVTIFT